MTKKQTPLTVELFFQEIMPRIEEVLDEKINEYRKDVNEYRKDVNEYRKDVNEYRKDVVKYRGEVRRLRQEIKTFPEQVNTYREEIKMYREELVQFKIEVMGEIKALREEIEIALHHYERMDARLARAEKKLGLNAFDL